MYREPCTQVLSRDYRSKICNFIYTVFKIQIFIALDGFSMTNTFEWVQPSPVTGQWFVKVSKFSYCKLNLCSQQVLISSHLTYWNASSLFLVCLYLFWVVFVVSLLFCFVFVCCCFFFLRSSYCRVSVNKDHTLYALYINPNTFVGLVGKVRKKLSPKGGREGGFRKKHAQCARRAWGSNPGPAAC